MALTTALLLCPFTVALDIFMLKKDIAKTHYNNTGVTTLLWGKCEVAIHTPENGTWESFGTPENLECNCRGQTPCIELFFISLEKSWSVDVQNGLAWAIWTFAT
jgi:hypothetical protein